jgi:hypothetical protein
MNLRQRQAERLRAIDARLGREYEIWVATSRGDGRPHLVPVWYVWLQDKIYFATGTHTQKWLNLLSSQALALSLPDPNNVLIIEGEAHACDRQTTETVAEYFFNKYEWDFRFDSSADWRLIEVLPHKMLAWGDGYDELGTRIL